MPLVGFAVRFGSGTGETFPRADRVMAAQCPLGDWYLLSKRRSRWPGRSAGCRPVPSNRARQKARQPASPRPRTRSSNPVPSSGESGELRMARPSSELLAPPRTRGVLRDEVVAERKIVYLRNVGQGSSGLEGEACSTLAMSSQRRRNTSGPAGWKRLGPVVTMRSRSLGRRVSECWL